MISQLQVEYLSRTYGRQLSRGFKLHKARAQKLVKAQVRKARTAILNWYRNQYFISTAYSDMKLSVRLNEDIFISICVIAIALGYAYAAIAAELIYQFFFTIMILSEQSGVNMLMLSLCAAVSLSVTLAWVVAFMLNSMSIAIMQGANRKKTRSVRSTLRQGLRFVGRTTSSWLAFLAALALPVMAVGVVALNHFMLSINTTVDALEVLPYYIIAAITGVIYMLLQYSLMPMVALFETDLSLKQAFERSRDLVRRKGRLFILGGYCLLGLALAVEYALATALQNLTGLNNSITFGLMAVVTMVYTHGILTMFYRKRRLARK